MPQPILSSILLQRLYFVKLKNYILYISPKIKDKSKIMPSTWEILETSRAVPPAIFPDVELKQTYL